jgi:hypothetical protein
VNVRAAMQISSSGGSRCSKQEMHGSGKSTFALKEFLLLASQIVWHKQRALV